MKFRPIALLFAISMLPLVHSRNVNIGGRAINMEGRELLFFTKTEDVLRKVKVLAVIHVEKDTFHISLNLEKTTPIWIECGQCEPLLYVEPGKTYQVELPYCPPKKSQQFADPFFEPYSILLVPRNFDDDELNHKIAMYESSFLGALDSISKYTYLPRMIREAGKFKYQLQQKYEKDTNTYFNDYLFYRLMFLQRLENPYNNTEVLSETLNKNCSNYNNPAFWDIFEILTAGYFTDRETNEFTINFRSALLSGKMQNLLNLIPVSNLYNREIFALKSIYDAAIEDPGLKANCENILKSFSIHGNLSDEIRKELRDLQPGDSVPYFELPAANGDLVPFSLEKRLVLLSFVYPEYEETQKDFQLLEKLKMRWNKEIEIVVIVMFQDLIEFQSFVKNYPETKLRFVWWDNDRALRSSFFIRAFPDFFLVGKDGRLILSHAPVPQEGLSQIVDNAIRSEKEKTNRNLIRELFR